MGEVAHTARMIENTVWKESFKDGEKGMITILHNSFQMTLVMYYFLVVKMYLHWFLEILTSKIGLI